MPPLGFHGDCNHGDIYPGTSSCTLTPTQRTSGRVRTRFCSSSPSSSMWLWLSLSPLLLHIADLSTPTVGLPLILPSPLPPSLPSSSLVPAGSGCSAASQCLPHTGTCQLVALALGSSPAEATPLPPLLCRHPGTGPLQLPGFPSPGGESPFPLCPHSLLPLLQGYILPSLWVRDLLRWVRCKTKPRNKYKHLLRSLPPNWPLPP